MCHCTSKPIKHSLGFVNTQISLRVSYDQSEFTNVVPLDYQKSHGGGKRATHTPIIVFACSLVLLQNGSIWNNMIRYKLL